MSTSNGYMQGKGRKVLNLVIEEAQHTDLKKVAREDHRSLATLVRELLRHGLDTRHGLSTRKVAARVDEHIDRLATQVTELREIVGRQHVVIESMAREMTTTKALVEHVAALLKERSPEVKKSWF